MTDTHSTPGAEQERLKHLLVSSAALPDEGVALARALGPDASGRIVVEVIEAPYTPSADGSAIRAANLARELGLVVAVQPLVRYVEGRGVHFPVGKTVLSILSRFGSAGVDALFDLLERSRNAEDRSRITEALARSDAEDERIRTHLVRLLEEDPGFAAPLLAQRGEWRAVPDLLRTFDVLTRRPVADCDICAADHLSAIGRAVLALGGRLPEEHSSKIDEAFERAEPLWTKVDDDWAERLASRTPAVRPPRPGRNEPCPCGSGKKYKRCCLGSERGEPRH